MARYCTAADVQQAICSPGAHLSTEGKEAAQQRIGEAGAEIDEALAAAGYGIPLEGCSRNDLSNLRVLCCLGAGAKITQADAAIQSFAQGLAAIVEQGLAAAKAEAKPAPKAKAAPKRKTSASDVTNSEEGEG